MKYKSIKVVYLDGWVKEYQKQTLECVIEDIFTDWRGILTYSTFT